MTEYVRHWRKGEGLTELISRRIADMIVDRQLKPGDPLPTEAELLESFDVGRSVIREAIVRLRALGVVDVKHGRGMFVASLPVGLLQARLRRAMEDQSDQAIRHADELRRTLLVAAARLTAAKGADTEALERALDNVRDGGRADVSTEVAAFSAAMAQACGNPLIEQLLANLGDILQPRDQAQWADQDRAVILVRLSDIVSAIRERDEAAGADAVRAALAPPG